MAVKILAPGLSTTVQDLGRPGYYHLGIPISGGMDRFALTIEGDQVTVERLHDGAVMALTLDRPDRRNAMSEALVARMDDMLAELRSDHAGETGAVWIYRGIALVTRDADLKAFALRHGATEQDHLKRVCEVLPWARRSWLLPAWRVAGFFTGALPALVGPRAVHATIAAVETFVDHHYQQQIDRIEGRTGVEALRALLVDCQADEVSHRDEAMALQTHPPGALLRAWCALVGSGSAMAVKLARLV